MPAIPQFLRLWEIYSENGNDAMVCLFALGF